jgi:hypothetical protein
MDAAPTIWSRALIPVAAPSDSGGLPRYTLLPSAL